MIKITKKMSGKMEGMLSLNTSCLTNPNCQAFSKIEGSVCQKCYANKLLSYRQNVSECFEKNAFELTTRILNNEEINKYFRFYNINFFRFEAFGDLINNIQLVNYINISKANKNIRFALWTKNINIINDVFSKIKQPRNLQLVLSSLYINKKLDENTIKAPANYKVFTVYDKKFIKDNNIIINCGAKKCALCEICYKKNNVKYINEKLK